MNVVLFLLYFFGGFFLAIIACSGIGFALSALLAFAKSFSRPKNVLLMLAYAGAAFVCYGLIIGGLYVAGWLGDRTGHAGQTGMLVGAIFPGILGFAIIPQFLSVASKQTSGIHVE